jgi:hypothetical protein
MNHITAMKKLNVTLEDTLADKHWRMFMAASTDLALVAHRLKVDPNSGGSAPIIAAIDELKNANAALVSALDRIKDVLNGVYVDDVALIVNKALKQNRKALK